MGQKYITNDLLNRHIVESLNVAVKLFHSLMVLIKEGCWMLVSYSSMWKSNIGGQVASKTLDWLVTSGVIEIVMQVSRHC